MKQLLIFALLLIVSIEATGQSYFVRNDKNDTIIISHKVSNFDTLLKVDNADLLGVPGTPAQKLQALTNWPNKVRLSQKDVIMYNCWGTKATEKKEYNCISSADGKSITMSSYQELIKERPAYEIVGIYIFMILIGFIMSYFKNNKEKIISYIVFFYLLFVLGLGLGPLFGLEFGLGLLFGLEFGLGFVLLFGLEFGFRFGFGFGLLFGLALLFERKFDFLLIITISILFYLLSYFLTHYIIIRKKNTIQPAA